MAKPAKRLTNPATTSTSIPTKEYRARRDRLLKELRGAVAVVFSGDGGHPLLGKWRVDANFFYLTGIDSERGAAVLFDPSAENPRRRITLFFKPLNPEIERWDGYREPISASMRNRLGFETVMRDNHLPMMLTAAARRAKRAACLHPFAVYPAPVSQDLAVFREISSRVVGLAIDDRTQLLPTLRANKSPAELALMARAIDATAAGYQAALRVIRPGATEADVEQALERAYRDHGAEGVAYNSIVGSGLNGTILHYNANAGPLAAGDLLVIDSAARVGGYAADVTRTYPVSGKFTPDQRHAYDVVLASQLAAIAACRPGATLADVDAAARDVIESAGFGDAFIHSVGHPIGLDVHETGPDGGLLDGMVVTIEPGIYFPEKQMGIRIEDDVKVSKRGGQVLTPMIGKTTKEIEDAMR